MILQNGDDNDHNHHARTFMGRVRWCITHIGVAQLSLILLAIQNISSALIIQMSRSFPEHNRYSPAAAIFVTEVMKLFMSAAMLLMGGESPQKIHQVLSGIKPAESLKLAVPAVLYTFQNNFLFVALSHLDSATFQVFSQLKVLTTALFSVTILNRRLYRIQWCALIVLICGVSLAQISDVNSKPKSPTIPSPPSVASPSLSTIELESSTQTESTLPPIVPANGPITELSLLQTAAESTLSAQKQKEPAQAVRTKNAYIGTLAVIALTLLSGFSGVYQEKIVKKSMTYPIAYLNIQLCAYSIITNLFSVMFQDGTAMFSRNFFHGFTSLTWLVVSIQSLGGILVSLVIRYTSNLAKSYVVSIAIFATGFISYMFLDFVLTLEFFIGAVLVTASVLLYNEPDQWKRDPYVSGSETSQIGLV